MYKVSRMTYRVHTKLLVMDALPLDGGSRGIQSTWMLLHKVNDTVVGKNGKPNFVEGLLASMARGNTAIQECVYICL